jgi:hypothetical protein
MKYAAKMEQKTVPEGYESVGRFWGVAGLRSCVEAATVLPAGEVGPATARECDKLRNELRELVRFERAREVRWEDRRVGYMIPEVRDQLAICRRLHFIAAKAAIERGGYAVHPFEPEDRDILVYG